MEIYDKNNLESVLSHIKDEYGANCFKIGKFIDVMNQLAPELKREKSLLQNLTMNGYIKEIVENSGSDRDKQQKTISDARSFLVDEECIQSHIADLYLNILCSIFHYKTELKKKTSEIHELHDSKANNTAHESVSKSMDNSGVNIVLPEYNDTIKCYLCGSINNISSKFCNMCGRMLIPPDSNKKAIDPKVFKVLFESIKKDIGLEMVFCPSGSFMMGSHEDELGRFDDEVRHRVTLTKFFYIGKFPVTQKQYQKITGKNPSFFKGDNHPVECVNWNDAKAFCERLNKIYEPKMPEGFNFDLPTESQWEYACRVGTVSALNSGKDLTSKCDKCSNLDKVAWYFGNSGGKTHPVGLKKPNAWGIYDMHGNVDEWCNDWYGRDISSEGRVDPTGPFNGTGHVLRGGSWYDTPNFCRSSYRLSHTPDDSNNLIGFRIALVLKESF